MGVDHYGILKKGLSTVTARYVRNGNGFARCRTGDRTGV